MTLTISSVVVTCLLHISRSHSDTCTLFGRFGRMQNRQLRFSAHHFGAQNRSAASCPLLFIRCPSRYVSLHFHTPHCCRAKPLPVVPQGASPGDVSGLSAEPPIQGVQSSGNPAALGEGISNAGIAEFLPVSGDNVAAVSKFRTARVGITFCRAAQEMKISTLFSTVLPKTNVSTVIWAQAAYLLPTVVPTVLTFVWSILDRLSIPVFRDTSTVNQTDSLSVATPASFGCGKRSWRRGYGFDIPLAAELLDGVRSTEMS